MGILNGIPCFSDLKAEQWVRECVEVMPKMKQKIMLLAFFGKGDIKNKPDLTKKVVRRLKKVAPGSPAVQVYYDTANSNKMGYNIYKEIRQL